MNVNLQYDSAAALATVRAAPGAVQRAMFAAADDATALWLVQMRRSPSPIALRVSVSTSGRTRSRLGNGYKRTGTLRKSWLAKRTRREGNSVIAEVVSSGEIAPYNVYVQMDAMQAWMHQGRWETEAMVIERTRGKVEQMAARRLNDALRSLR